MPIGAKKLVREASEFLMEHLCGGEKIWAWITQEKENIIVLKKEPFIFSIASESHTVDPGKVPKKHANLLVKDFLRGFVYLSYLFKHK